MRHRQGVAGHGSARSRWMALAVLLLAGCAQPEDRINAAMPVDAAVLQARIALESTARTLGADVAALERDYATALALRARECGHGHSPGPFSSQASIRKALTDRGCFQARDRALRQWLELRRVGLLVAAPPLRALPGAPSALATDSAIGHVEWASQAGVLLLQAVSGYRTFDLGNGRVLHQGSDGEDAQGLSANGRVFLVQARDELQLRASENGQLLATLPGVPAAHFHWLGTQGALFHRDSMGRARGGRLVYVDFASGRESPLPATATRIARVAPMPGREGHFALVSTSRVAELALRREGQDWTVRLLAERVLPTAAFADRAAAISADGRLLVGVEGSLQLLDLATLRARSVPLLPFQPDAVTLTPQAGVVLLGGRFPDAGLRRERYLYSIDERTLARVDEAALPASQVLYAPSLRRNATVRGAAIAWVDTLAHAPPVAADLLLDDRQAMALALAREQALDMPAIARARLEHSRALDARAAGSAPAAAVAGASRP